MRGGSGLVTKLCSTLATPWTLPGSSVHGIFQARVQEWVAIFFSGGSSWPRDRTQASCIASRYFTDWATREAPVCEYHQYLAKCDIHTLEVPEKIFGGMHVSIFHINI